MPPFRVLIVDDNRSAADALARVLRKQDYDVEAVYDGQTAIDRIRSEGSGFGLVLTDLKMEPIDGLSVLRAARERSPPTEVIVFTAYGGVDTAVKAMRLGARDFLTKPVTVEQVVLRLVQIQEDRGLTAPSAPAADEPFVARSPRGRDLYESLRRAAGVPSPVWIYGEVGSGRGHAALTLHRLGTNPEAPFVVRDVARDAAWQEAGTCLLPSVDVLSDEAQLALYRSLSSVPEGVRLVATAGDDGRRLVAEGRLRPELYYALSVLVIPVPPLRARAEDVQPLLEAALRRLAARYDRPCPVIDPAQALRLVHHAWPGNIRELLNLAERTVVMGAESFDFELVEAPASGIPKLEPGFDLAVYLDGVERRILVEALRVSDGDRNRAGRLLGVERNTLRYKLNKHGLLDR